MNINILRRQFDNIKQNDINGFFPWAYEFPSYEFWLCLQYQFPPMEQDSSPINRMIDYLHRQFSTILPEDTSGLAGQYCSMHSLE